MILEVALHLGDDLGVVGALGIEPKHRGRAAGPGAVDGKLDPILNRRILGLAHAPDVPGLHFVLHQYRATLIHHLDHAIGGDFEGLVVGTILLGLLGHQPHIGDAAHGGGIEGAVLAAVIDHFLIDTGVATIGNQRLGIVELAVRPPHLAGIPDHGGHGGIDDDVAGYVKVGDSLVGVDHRKGRPLLIGGGNVGLDGGALIIRQIANLGEQIAEAVVGVNAQGFEGIAVFVEHVLEEHGDGVAEHDGVGHLHHSGLEVQGQQHTVGPGIFDLGGEEGPQGAPAHHRRIDDLARQQCALFLQYPGAAVVAQQLDTDRARGRHCHGLLAAVEVALTHVGHMGFRVLGPGAHLMGILAGVGLHRGRGAAIGIALPKHRIHGAALHPVIAGFDVLLGVVLGVFRVVREIVSLLLQLLDGRHQLGHGRADIGQFDNVGFGRGGQLAQFRQVVADALLVAEALGKLGDDAAGQGNIAGLDGDASGTGKGLNDGQQGIGCQGRGLIGQGIDDFGCHGSS